jgi:hypothetical protein
VNLKKIAVSLAALILTIALAACSGGSTGAIDDADTAGTKSVDQARPAPAPAAAPARKAEVRLPRPFEQKTTTPAFFLEALKQKEPLLVFFYNDDPLSQDVMAEVKQASEHKNYAGAVKLILLRLPEAGENDPEVLRVSQEAIKLVEEFSASYVPYMAVLNRNNQIIFEKKGFVDSLVIEQALYDALNK